MSVKWWIGITQSLACSYRVVQLYTFPIWCCIPSICQICAVDLVAHLGTTLAWSGPLSWVQLGGVLLDSSVKRRAPKVGDLSVRGPSASLEAYCVWEPGEVVRPTTQRHTWWFLTWAKLHRSIFFCIFWHSAHSSINHIPPYDLI